MARAFEGSNAVIFDVFNEPFPERVTENDWVGRTVAIGEQVRLQVTGHCPRCVMTTLRQGELPKDSGILRMPCGTTTRTWASMPTSWATARFAAAIASRLRDQAQQRAQHGADSCGAAPCGSQLVAVAHARLGQQMARAVRIFLQLPTAAGLTTAPPSEAGHLTFATRSRGACWEWTVSVRQHLCGGCLSSRLCECCQVPAVACSRM